MSPETRKLLQRLGETVRIYRTGKRLSQKQLATLAGTSQARISGIERGLFNLRLKTLDRVGRALGLMVTAAKPSPYRLFSYWDGTSHANGTLATTLCVSGGLEEGQ